MLDAPGYSKRLWAELEEQYGVRGLNRIRNEMIAIHLENDYVHVLGWTKDREYMAKSVFALKSDILLENIKEEDVLDKNTVSFEKLPSPVKRTVQCIQQYYNVEHTAQLSRIMKIVEYVRLSVTNECFVTAVEDVQRRELEEIHNNAAVSKTLSVREKINTLYENVNVALDRVKASLDRVLLSLESGKAVLGLRFGFSQVCAFILLASGNRTFLQMQKSVASFGRFRMNYEKMEQLQERIPMPCGSKADAVRTFLRGNADKSVSLAEIALSPVRKNIEYLYYSQRKYARINIYHLQIPAGFEVKINEKGM